MQEMSKKTKVAHVVLSLQPGGLEMLIANLVRSSEMRGIDFVIFCLDELGALSNQVRSAGAKVILIKRRAGLDLPLIFRLRNAFIAEQVNAVHTHSLDPMFYAGVAAFLAGIPLRVHTQHNIFLFDSGFKDKLKYWIASLFFHRIVAVSARVKSAALSVGVSARKCSIIVNGIDPERFAVLRDASSGKKIGADGNACWTFGTVARLSPEKAIDKMLDAFALICKGHADSRLLIIGEGPCRTSLEERTKKIGIAGQVEFAGFKANPENDLAKMDVFLLSSLSEGIPLALLEAMAAGLPVVATEVGGIPEVIGTSGGGLLVPVGDSSALATAATRIMTQPRLRQEMGARSANRVRQSFSLSAMAHSYRSLYEAVNDGESRLSRFLKEYVFRTLPRRLMIWQGEKKSSRVALTFDDGPDCKFTLRILKILKEHGVSSTFFLVGENAERETEIVRTIAGDGHEIANHSYSHPDFANLSLSAARREVVRAESALTNIGLPASRFFRPPRGKLCWSSLLSAWRQKLTIAMWNVDLKDFRAQQEQEIHERLASISVSNGDIVLYHGNNEAAVNALPKVIDVLKQNGRECVTLSALMER